MRLSSHQLTFFAILACLAGASTAQEAPSLPRAVSGSPGSLERIVAIEGRCPGFSWGAFAGAHHFELAAFELSAGFDPQLGAAPEPPSARVALHVELPGTLSSWTPSLDDCLRRGERYAWFVRALGEEDRPLSEWSAPRLVEVPRMPSREELARALEVLDAYRSSLDHGGVAPAPALAAPFTEGDVASSVDQDTRVAKRTISPASAKLTVVESSNGGSAAAIFGNLTNGGDQAAAIVGTAASGSEISYGVLAESRSSSPDAAGVYGLGSIGVKGEGSIGVNGSSGTQGVVGEATSSSSSTSIGVLGTTLSSSSSSAGVVGLATAGGTGVRARSESSGPALRLEHGMGGGVLVSSGGDVFTVDAAGDVTANSFTGDGSGLTGITGSTELVFRTIDAPSGTDPVADSSTDTLTLQASGAVSIVGDSSLDAVAFDVADDAIDGTELADTITLDANLLLQGSFTTSLDTLGTSVNAKLDVDDSGGGDVADVLRVSKLQGGSAADGILVLADDAVPDLTVPRDSATRLPAAGATSESTIVDGIDVSHPGITNAINVGDNTIFGGAFSIQGASFSVFPGGEGTFASLSLIPGAPAPPFTLMFPPVPDGVALGSPPGTVYYDLESDTLCLVTTMFGAVPLGPPPLIPCTL